MQDRNQGEGNYEAAREFQEAQHEFAKSGQVEERAREAAEAIESEEGAELEKAREAAAKGDSEPEQGSED